MSMKPYDWNDEAPTGVLSPSEGLASDGGLHLLGLPTAEGAALRRMRSLDTTAGASASVVGLIDDVAIALSEAARNGRAWRRRVDDQSRVDRENHFDALGEGEVSIVISGGASDEGVAQIVETSLPGVWRGRAEDAKGALATEWIEVADAPRAFREAALTRPRVDLAVEALSPPKGAMNVMGVLSEIRARAAEWRPGQPNHVLNFTLFPMSEVDAAFLARVLGEVGVRATSGGYGAARVVMTALRNVWAVQYLNGLGAIILDTVEIGDAPDALLAAAEDFEDSAARLQEIRGAYAT